MTREEFKARFPEASDATIARNCSPHRLQNSKPQPNFIHAIESQDARKKDGAGRCRVSVVSFRSRLCDVDNLAGGAKFVIDGLRYAGLIQDDSPEHIELVVSQRKVKKLFECTEITITLL